MRRKKLLPGLLFCLSALQLQAQQSLKGGAPDAKLIPGLGGDGNQGSIYSSDLFNGTANVTVPIYSYGDKGISLSYNTSGVKVDELSAGLGLHWSLNAGGSITRVMKDVPDEINTYNSTSSLMGSGNIGDYTLGLKGKWTQYFGGANPSSSTSDQARYMDDESDDFIFSVGSLSFTFNIGLNRFVFTNPHTDIQIDILVNGNPVTQMPLSSDNASLNFRVRDAQGNWYYFAKGDVSRKTYFNPDVYGNEIELSYTSKWVISKIVQSDGQEINYQYNELAVRNTGNYTNLYNNFTAEERDNAAPVITGTIITSDDILYSTKQIASISYPNAVKATFVYDPTSGSRCDDPTNGGTNPVLREIQIKQVDAGTRYVMDQGYSVAPYNSSTPAEILFGSPCYDITAVTDDYRYHRLILKGVKIVSIDGNIIQPYYSFNYNTTKRLPPRFSGCQDYFGYYNGKSVSQNNGMLSIPYHVPKYGTSSTAYGVDRNDDFTFAVSGILTSVKNGSGGLTEFEYEGHELSNVISDANITLPPTTDAYFFGRDANDGVRLRSIKTSNPRYPGIYTQQNYTYAAGQRFMPGGYFFYPLYTNTPSAMFTSTFVSPHQFINGSNHGYSTVTVETKNSYNQLLSKRVNTFQNISRGINQTSYFRTGNRYYFNAPNTDKQYIKEWEIGLPLTTTDYDQNNKIVSFAVNTYSSILDDGSTMSKVENLKTLATTEINGTNAYPTVTETYRPYTGASLLTKTVTRKYINNASFINDEVTYKYDGYNNIEHTITTNSRGESFLLKNVYNYNVSGTDVPYGTQAGTLHDMTDAGLQFKVGIERWKLSTVNPPLNNKLLDASITRFEYQNNKINTRKIFSLLSLDPIGYTDYTGISSVPATGNIYGKILAAYSTSSGVAGFRQVSEVLQYDDKGNPLETKISDQEIYKSMLWEPVLGQKVADVSNAHLKDIGFTSFERSPGLSYTGSENSTDGGFQYNQWGVQQPGYAISGTYVYKLIPPGSSANNKITSPILTAGTTYVMTFWTKGNAPKIAGAGLNNIDYTNIHFLNDWVQWTATFTPQTSGSLLFTTTQTLYIDEIRLFPKGAQMTNAVYTPMAGATSTTDAQGRITYYLYDALGRQTVVKDQDGNVISKQERHIVQ